MSLILDALKKLERETVARKEGLDKVTDQIYQPDHDAPKRRKIFMLIIIAACSGALAAVVLMGGFSGVIKQTPAATPAAPTLASPVAAPIISSQKEESLPAVEKKLPVQGRLHADVRTDAMRRSTEQHLEDRVPDTRNAATAPSQIKLHSNASSDLSKSASERPLPSLNVSGIVWQDERSARRAVVNDIVAEEGAVINGVKIVEICPNKVRFSRGSELFELSIQKVP